MTTELRFIRFLHALQSHRAQSHGHHVRVQASERLATQEIYQASNTNALLGGHYDGTISFGELKEHGDFGLGTLDALDGEMVAIDGAFYQIRSDGTAYRIDDTQKTPFAVVQFFRADYHETLNVAIDYAGLRKHLGDVFPPSHIFYAIRIDGTFDCVEARSVPRQAPPYQPLLEVLKTQKVFEYHNVKGTLVGFRFPGFEQGEQAEYHLHLITEDRTGGGHALDWKLQSGQLAIEHMERFHAELPAE